jgi:hypothetical protein
MNMKASHERIEATSISSAIVSLLVKWKKTCPAPPLAGVLSLDDVTETIVSSSVLRPTRDLHGCEYDFTTAPTHLKMIPMVREKSPEAWPTRPVDPNFVERNL